MIVIIIVVGFLMSGGNDTATQSYEGIHIMADGTIMLSDGEIVEGAEVTPGGMIRLPDGAMIEPVMDLREGDSMGEMETMEMDNHEHEPGTPDEHEHE